MGSSHSHHEQHHEHHDHGQEERNREEERVRTEAEAARTQAEESRRQTEEARGQQEEAQRCEEEALWREHEARQRAEEMRRREDEAWDREEKANRAANEARRVLEEIRRRDEELRQREEEARRREELARQQAEANKRAAQEAEQREKEAQDREAESKRLEEEAREAVRKAQEEEERARNALAQTNICLSIGVQPEVWPTEEEFSSAYARIEYNPEKVHIAVCGSSGTGKSSLINAFRGLANHNEGAAPAGPVETTRVINRYPDGRAEFPDLVWFDAPGAGTLDMPGWQYFNRQGLFIFDVIILVYDTRFTEIDVAFVQNCERYGIPLYVVRSKADMHIDNIKEDIKPDSDEGDEPENEEFYKLEARQTFIHSTRRDFERNLDKAQLTRRDVFIVSRIVIRALVNKTCNSKVSDMMIDEARLLEAILKECKRPQRL